MSKIILYYSGISSLIYISASVVFFSVFENIHGGIWAGAAALLATQCFILHLLHSSNQLHMFYKQQQLKRLTTASFIIVLLSTSFLIWYTFAAVYWKIPFFDYGRTQLFALVFCFITGKWGVHLYGLSKRYAEQLTDDYSPITQTV